MNNDFYTQAVNFPSAVTHGVDPRTGLYSAVFTLGTLTGNNGMGPSLPLSFMYSPLNTQDLGFGTGISLPFSCWDTQRGRLTLSDGGSWSVEETRTALVVRQQKVKTFLFSKDDTDFCSEEGYVITHKSGEREFLSGTLHASDIKVPLRIRSATGHQLNFQWEMRHYDTPHLTAVTDDSDTCLLAIHYDNNQTILTVWPGAPEEYRIILLMADSRLVSVSNSTEPSMPLKWTLQYSNVGHWGVWLTGLSYPGGMCESVTYLIDGEANNFPIAAGLPALPYVTSMSVRASASAPPLLTRYTYTRENFLGYNSCQSWESLQDNLYGPMTNYTYSSTQTIDPEGMNISVTRIYNCYHLLIAEKRLCGETTHNKETVYYAVMNLDFAAQPAICLFPKQVTETWSEDGGASRQEITQTSFDDNGNLLKTRFPDGSVTTYEYYPAVGDGDNCPAEPYGFVRFLRQQTVMPATADICTEFSDTENQMTQYTWRALSTGGTPAILKHEERHLSGLALLMTETLTYALDPLWRGRITTRTNTIWQGGVAAGTTTDTFAARVESNEIHYEHTFTGHDKLAVSESFRYQRWSHRLLENKNAQGLTTRYTWDSLGREKTCSFNPGTAYEKTLHSDYGVADPETSPAGAVFQVTHTDPLGNQQRTYLDAFLQVISRKSCLADSPSIWITHLEQNYDKLRRLQGTTICDQEYNANKGNYALSQVREYDYWGQICRHTESDGVVTELTASPVTLKQTSYRRDVNSTQRSATQITCYNLSHQKVSEEYLDEKQQRLAYRTWRYDGLHRLRQSTEWVSDTESRSTLYTLDAFGRVTETRLPDNTRISREYAAFSSKALLTKISVNGTLTGTQRFDGLGRLSRATSGGRTQQCVYQSASSPHPEQVITPDNITIERTYIPELGHVVSKLTAGDIKQTFRYHSLTGALLDATEGTHSIRYTLNPVGRPCELIESLDGQTVQHRSWTYSRGGVLSNETDVLKNLTQTLGRDSYGRIKAISDKDVSAIVTRDALGRVTAQSSYVVQNATTIQTTLVLDGLGRETHRQIMGNGMQIQMLQKWQQNSQLKSRQTIIQARNGVDQCTESYRYDSRNRLVNYTVNGNPVMSPLDSKGRAFTGQTFCYDAWSNVTKRETDYPLYSQADVYIFGNPDDPCQMTGISSDDGSTSTLTYDAAGRVVRQDVAGRGLDYDALGRLKTVTLPGGGSGDYGYDALNRMVSMPDAGGNPIRREYTGNTLQAVQSHSGQRTRLVYLNGQNVAQVSAGDTRVLATDHNGTVLGSSSAGVFQDMQFNRYTPWGGQSTEPDPGADAKALAGFNGEVSDPFTGLQPLGNGCRLYDTELMRFMSPESLSPFGVGGINAYAYCIGDPINNMDPSGHFSLGKFLGWLGIGIASLGLFFTGVGLAEGTMALSVALAVNIGLDVVSIATGIPSLLVHDKKIAGILGFFSLIGAIGSIVLGAGNGLIGGRFISESSAEFSSREGPILATNRSVRFGRKSIPQNIRQHVNNVMRSGARNRISGRSIYDAGNWGEREAAVEYRTNMLRYGLEHRYWEPDPENSAYFRLNNTVLHEYALSRIGDVALAKVDVYSDSLAARTRAALFRDEYDWTVLKSPFARKTLRFPGESVPVGRAVNPAADHFMGTMMLEGRHSTMSMIDSHEIMSMVRQIAGQI